MNAEIELKLFFLPEDQQSLINKLDSLDGSVPKGQRRLTNGYFDTPSLQLRKWDMGLRVRGFDAHKEQTIKTAGQVVGGIHSRPEYNVTIQADEPDLQLFPAEIWPEGAQLTQVQAQLACVFHTDFYRRTWHISVDQSVVEVALDRGEISANGQVEALCEVEFELLSGNTEALLTLAKQVASTVPVRLGKASKAQRGYQLAGQSKAVSLAALEFLPLVASNNSLNSTCLALLETALERWQLLEAMIGDANNAEACVALWWRMRACIRLINMTLEQFGLNNASLAAQFSQLESQLHFIEHAQSLAALLGSQARLISRLEEREALKAQLELSLSQLDLAGRLTNLWQQTYYGQLQLTLVDLMLKLAAQEVSVSQGQSLQQHANQAQQQSWQAINEAMPAHQTLSSADYLAATQVLDLSIQVGQAYGSLYDPKTRDAFRAPWQDLTLGIKTLACYQTLAQTADVLDVDLSLWQQEKEQSLLFAMEASRRNALQQAVYW